MRNQVKLRSGQYLIQESITVPESKSKEEVDIVEYIILDRSGSMGGTIGRCIETVKKYVESAPAEKKIVVGFFSSAGGEYGLSQLHDLSKNRKGLLAQVESYNSTLGLTCFDEVLSELFDYHRKNHPNSKIALAWFTDGGQNDGKPRSEVLKVLEANKDLIAVSVYIGYAYLDRAFMSQMAATTDGSFIHISDFSQFANEIDNFGTSVSDSSSKTISHKINGDIAVQISGQNVIEYTPVKGAINFKCKKIGNTIFYISKKSLADAKDSQIDDKFEKGARALAYVLSQKTRVNDALDIMDTLGDKEIVSKLYYAMTDEEFGKAESTLRETIFNKDSRYKKGQQIGFLPDPNALSVYDVLLELEESEEALLHLYKLDYDVIGIANTASDGAKFVRDKVGVKVNDIVFNATRPNVNVNVTFPGTVELDPKQFKQFKFTEADLKKLGLEKIQKVAQFRNRAIITDGRLNMSELPVSGLSKSLVKRLKDVDAIKIGKDGVDIVELHKLPIINKSYITKDTVSATSLAKLVRKEKDLKTEAQVLRALVKEKTPAEKEVSKKELVKSGDTAAFLEKLYIKGGIYNPPVEVIGSKRKVLSAEGNKLFLEDCKGLRKDTHVFGLGKEAQIESIDHKNKAVTLTLKEVKVAPEEVVFKMKDHYEALDFEVTIEGEGDTSYSAYKKLKNISDKWQKFHELVESYKSKPLATLEKALERVEKEVKVVGLEIKKRKIVILLSNKGEMPEFTSRENRTLIVEGSTFRFDITPIKAYI